MALNFEPGTINCQLTLNYKLYNYYILHFIFYMRFRFILVLLLCTFGFVGADAQSIIVNEVMVGNVDVKIDPSYNYGGWVELYNPTETSYNLGSHYVSDDPTNLKKHQLPKNYGSVLAGRFRTMWFDHYDTGTAYSTNANKQVGFKLDPDGGTLYISNPNGELVLEQSYPPSIPRVSFARTTDGGDEWRYTSTPTVAATNVGSSFADERLEAPQVDCDATVFSEPFTVHVAIPEGATLRYTKDGSTPTLRNGLTSISGIFNIEKQNYVLRFCLFKDGYLPSPVVTRTYIFKNRNYYLPIVSVVTDDENLFDDTIGAYVDGTNGCDGNNRQHSNKNRSWERPVNFEYILPDSFGEYRVMAVNQEMDFEVNGGWSRHFSPASSFKLKSDKRYEGANYIDFPVFASKPYIKNKAIVVRNGGNDNNCRIMDAAIHEILRSSGFYIDCQAWQPSHVFINGVYKFMFNIRETNNKLFAYSNYGIDNEEVDQFEINSVDGYKQKTGDDVVFMQWLTLATQLANDPENDDLYRQICDIVDIDEYCNYMAAECYVGCNDWLTNSNNVKGFRSRQDGKFHLVFMDLDQGFAMNNMMTSLSHSRNDSRYSTRKNFLIDIFLNMLTHEAFRRQFIDAYCIVAGSIFEPERVNSIITRMAQTTEEALSFDGLSPWNSANSLIQKINNTGNRDTRINALRSYFGLDDGYEVSVSANIPEAEISLNGQKIPTARLDGPLFGEAVLTTSAPADYRFVGWKMEGDVVSKTPLVSLEDNWAYYDQGSLDEKNWASPTYNASAWTVGAAPLGYGSIRGANGGVDINTTLDFGADSQNKRSTYYFRHQFTMDKTPTKEQEVELTFHVDDGCIIYINGREVKRYNMPEGSVSYSDYAVTYVGNAAYSETISVDPSLIRKGTNTIGVEVHNNSATSSDIYWALELSLRETVSAMIGETLNLATLGASSDTYKLQACYEPLSDDSVQKHQDIHPYAPIRINEISASNTVYANEYFKRNDWIELYNTTSVPFDVAGLYISDNPSKPQKYQIPGNVEGVNTIIPPHGYLIIWADKLDPRASLVDIQWEQTNTNGLHVPFKLSNSDSQQVLITSSETFVANNATYFEAHPAFREFTDRIFYHTHQGDQTVGRYPDGGNNLYVMNRPTIYGSNYPHTYNQFIGKDCRKSYEEIELAIEPIAIDSSNPSDAHSIKGIYTLSGMLTGHDPQSLRPGIYIIRYQNGSSRKITIK